MTNYFNSSYNPSLSSVYNNRPISAISALSIINNIPKGDVIKEATNDLSSFRSLFMQVQAMAELDKTDPIGKKLNIII
jgi:hypothetical protein